MQIFKNLAVIPARSGSKRIKYKNIRLFKNKPLIYWTIKAALESKIFDYIFVSTDSLKIKKIVEGFGLNVPFLRPKVLADDKTSVQNVTIKAIEDLQNYKNLKFKNVVQLMPNCPLRNATDIKAHFNNFLKNKLYFQISCMSTLGSNSWWSFYYQGKKVKRLFPKFFKKRSQDLPFLYTPTGAIWIANVEKLLKEKTFYNKHTKHFEINWYSGIDIDHKEDLQLINNLKSVIKR